jgi:hypothetical protein
MRISLCTLLYQWITGKGTGLKEDHDVTVCNHVLWRRVQSRQGVKQILQKGQTVPWIHQNMEVILGQRGEIKTSGLLLHSKWNPSDFYVRVLKNAPHFHVAWKDYLASLFFPGCNDFEDLLQVENQFHLHVTRAIENSFWWKVPFIGGFTSKYMYALPRTIKKRCKAIKITPRELLVFRVYYQSGLEIMIKRHLFPQTVINVAWKQLLLGNVCVPWTWKWYQGRLCVLDASRHLALVSTFSTFVQEWQHIVTSLNQLLFAPPYRVVSLRETEQSRGVHGVVRVARVLPDHIMPFSLSQRETKEYKASLFFACPDLVEYAVDKWCKVITQTKEKNVVLLARDKSWIWAGAVASRLNVPLITLEVSEEIHSDTYFTMIRDHSYRHVSFTRFAHVTSTSAVFLLETVVRSMKLLLSVNELLTSHFHKPLHGVLTLFRYHDGELLPFPNMKACGPRKELLDGIPEGLTSLFDLYSH